MNDPKPLPLQMMIADRPIDIALENALMLALTALTGSMAALLLVVAWKLARGKS